MTVAPLLYESELIAAYHRLLTGAKRADFAFALIGERGFDLLRHKIDLFLKKGGQLRILVGVDLSTSPEVLRRLRKLESRSVKIKRFESGERRIFHPKFAVFGNVCPRAVIVGSSNLTGLGLAQNFEANVLIQETVCARKFREYFDELFEGARAKSIDDEWLSTYSKIWRRAQKLESRIKRERLKLKRTGPKRSRIPSTIKSNRFAFTGKIDGWIRDEKLYPRVRRLGGIIVTSADRLTADDYLVHGDILGGKSSTKKLRMARHLKSNVLTEDEFLALLHNSRSRTRSKRKKRCV